MAQRTRWKITIDFAAEKKISSDRMDQFLRCAEPLDSWYTVYPSGHHGCISINVNGFNAAAAATRLQTLNDILDRVLDDEIVFDKVTIECIGVQDAS